MVTKDRRAIARHRARELQKAEAERLARMQAARTDAFIALEALDEALGAFGAALDRLLDEGEKKGKLAKDFVVPIARINEALEIVGSAYAPGSDEDKNSEQEELDGDEKGDSSESESGEESDVDESSSNRDS